MDNTLKQRLIGATVLVALAVIFLPMLVKGPSTTGGADDVPLGAPAAPGDGQFQTRELPLVVPAGTQGGSVTGMQQPAALPPAASAPATDPAVAAAGDYAVNYGAYASQTDARTVIGHLTAAGFTAFSEPTTLHGQSAWRVRIGPYADRAAAEAVRLRAAALRSDVTPQVVVLDAAGADPARAPVADAAAVAAVPAASPSAPTPTPAAEPKPAPVPAPKVQAPPAPAPAPKPAVVATPKPAPAPAARPAASPAPAASALGWVVQLGAFSNANEANALRERVRGAGFSAFVEQVPSDSGTLNRVRVGPVASREAAEQLKAQLAARTGASGMVRQHP